VTKEKDSWVCLKNGHLTPRGMTKVTDPMKMRTNPATPMKEGGGGDKKVKPDKDEQQSCGVDQEFYHHVLARVSDYVVDEAFEPCDKPVCHAPKKE
jgi:hypothetical protein